jgi:hypothetical protein
MRVLFLLISFVACACAVDRVGCLVTTRCEACDPSESAAPHCALTGSRLIWTCRTPGTANNITTVREACTESDAQESLLVFQLVTLSLLALSCVVVRFRKATNNATTE